ncbi:MAG: hypothetical protein ACKOX2_02435, partial [Microcystaceae cyanobacterium]
IVPTWWAIAAKALQDNPNLVVVCGRRRERFPERSIFNRLCDLEWDTPIGEARACGGGCPHAGCGFGGGGGI